MAEQEQARRDQRAQNYQITDKDVRRQIRRQWAKELADPRDGSEFFALYL